jgi:hypothetical protein
MVVLAGCFVAAGALTSDEIEDLKKKVKIGSVSDDEMEEDDVEYMQVKFYTIQDEDSADEHAFYVKVTVELTDKKTKTVCYAQFARMQGAVDTEYTGEDNWEFVVPFGDLEKPKITAYAVQYGVIEDKEFIVLAEQMDDVDTVEELTTRTPTRTTEKPRILHQYSYRDIGSEDEEIIQSMWE